MTGRMTASSIPRKEAHRALRLAIDATVVAPGMSGIGGYVDHLVRALATIPDIGEIRLLSNRAPDFAGALPAHVSWDPRLRSHWRAPWMQFDVPRYIRRMRPDITHYTNFLAPVLYRHPYVVTFHDMSLFRHPEYFGWQKRVLTRSALPRIARDARAILTITEAMRREVHEILGTPLEKVFVVHIAAADRFAAPEKRPVGAAYSAPDSRPKGAPYVLFVGNLEPRKNLARLLDAFAILKSETNLPHALHLAGGGGWRNEAFRARLHGMRHRDVVRLHGYVPAADLPALVAGADLLVFPSIYEGFGMPPLEAMCCGVPVVASDIAAHREVLGDAALLVDPLDPAAIAEGMRRVLTDEELASSLRERGTVRAALYSWERTARETLDVYRRALDL